MTGPNLDKTQAAAADQFNRQSDRYGKSHILAETSDVEAALQHIVPTQDAAALDVATGGGHTALCLARLGWKVTAVDIAPRMLENAKRLLSDAGYSLETKLSPAEDLPFSAASFEVVTVRVAPHHFSSPANFIKEVARVLKIDGHFI